MQDAAQNMRLATNVIGDKWSLLILWASLQGASRFDEYQRTLSIARNILSARLKRLVDAGLMEKAPVSLGSRRLGYFLTLEGKELGTLLDLLEKYAHRRPERVG